MFCRMIDFKRISLVWVLAISSLVAPLLNAQPALGSLPGKSLINTGIDSLPFEQALGEIEILQRQGHLHDAMFYLQRLHETRKDSLTTRQQALLLTSLGNSLADSGKTTEAMQAMWKSVQAAEKSGDLELQALTRLNRGNLFVRMKRYISAVGDYDACLEMAERTHNMSLMLKAQVNRAKALINGENIQAGLKELQIAKQKIAEATDSRDKAYAQINLALSYEDLSIMDSRAANKHLHSAQQLIKSALAITKRTNDNYAQSYALGHLAGNQRKLGKQEMALPLYQQAAFLAQQENAPEILFRWEWKAGQILREQGNIDDAIKFYRRAVYNLQNIRDDMPLGLIGNTSFRDVIGPVYFELADILLMHAKHSNNPADVQEKLIEAQATIETLKTAELQDYFQDDCVTGLQSKLSGLNTIGNNTAVFYPIILPDRIELLLTTETGISQYTVKVSSPTITEEVHKFRQQLSDFTSHKYLPHARKLYKWLVAPLEEELEAQNIDTLVVVPDGALRNIPFAALHDGTQFLTHKYAMAVTPGLTLMDPRPLERKDMQILLNGLTKSVQGFIPLPNVGKELNDISKIYGGKILKDENYHAQSMQDELTGTPYRVIHIASHGQFKGNAKETFLLTYDEKLSMDRLEDFIRLSKYRDEPVELLTLSACQTAAGDDRAALGLAGVAVKAGARSVLASLWFINDEATSVLITEFYHQLKDSKNSKAQALQKAQMKLLGSEKYMHPGFWAPFLMIGNWL